MTSVTVDIVFIPGSGAVECVEDCFVIRVTGVVDAGIVDAVVVDAGVVDAGVVDAGVVNAWIFDGGVVDGGVVDGGVVDSGVVDSGVVGGGLVDAVDGAVCVDSSVLVCNCVLAAKEHGSH